MPNLASPSSGSVNPTFASGFFSTGKPVRLTSVRQFGESITPGLTASNNSYIKFSWSGAGASISTDTSTVTGEKTNSRSVMDGTYGNKMTFSGGTGGNYAIHGALNAVSHSAIIFSGLYGPLSPGQDGSILQATATDNGTSTPSINISCSEVVSTPCNRLSRKSRKGLFVRFGNESHVHKKTGGGAFELIAPHFDNDITWVDPSAWRNGSAQANNWSMQLFGEQVPETVGVKSVNAVAWPSAVKTINGLAKASVKRVNGLLAN
jgi:hypothetical protein